MPNNWEENIREGELRCKLLNGQSKKDDFEDIKDECGKRKVCYIYIFILIEKSIYSLK
jgi:hypothetical protein